MRATGVLDCLQSCHWEGQGLECRQGLLQSGFIGLHHRCTAMQLHGGLLPHLFLFKLGDGLDQCIVLLQGNQYTQVTLR